MEGNRKAREKRIADAKKHKKAMRDNLKKEMDDPDAPAPELSEPVIIVEDTPNGPVIHKFRYNIKIY